MGKGLYPDRKKAEYLISKGVVCKTEDFISKLHRILVFLREAFRILSSTACIFCIWSDSVSGISNHVVTFLASYVCLKFEDIEMVIG